MGILRTLMAFVFVAYATTASAVTLNTATAVVGGPTIMDTGGLLVSSSLGTSYAGGIQSATGVTIPSPVLFSSLTLNLGVVPNTFDFNITPIPPNPPLPVSLLTGSFLEAEDAMGSITALFLTTGGDFAPDFGSHFRVTITDPFIPDGVLSLAPPASFFSSTANLLVEAVEAAPAPIPLPAGVWLLLAGLGGLGALRKSRQV